MSKTSYWFCTHCTEYSKLKQQVFAIAIEALKEKLERKERSQMISEEVHEALRKEYEDVRSENMQLREALIGLQSRLVEYISKYNRLKHAMTDADNLLADALAYEDAIEARLKEEDKP